VLNFNTGKKSWWFTSSFGCSKQISLELEQLQSQEQLNLIRTLIESTTITTSPLPPSTTTSTTTRTKVVRLDDFFRTPILSMTATVNAADSEKNQSQSYRHLDQFMQAYCFLPFYTIEIIHAGLLIFLAVISIYIDFLYDETNLFFKF
jgi:hypothetical protein